MVNEAKEKYGTDVCLYNISIDENMKEHILTKVNKNLPFIVKDGKLID